ncbi:MAG TPA: sulfatase-like hydrolase/transferase [Phycisphaerales bacterium]|nr:sulfatase-like hydrolase/transferase [Phycisphaerales bacterium]
MWRLSFRWAIAVLSVLACRAGAGEQPNIVLIMLDDAGYNEIGYTGDNVALTPSIDALAAEGIRFSDAYVSQPQCSPCRAGLLTGVYEQRFGYEHNPSNGYQRTDGLQPGQTLISHRLRALGYTTGLVGKWHMGAKDGYNRPLDMGFDEFFGFLGGNRSYWGGEHGTAGRMYRQNTAIEDQWVLEGDPNDYDPVHGRYLTDAFGDEAALFIDRHASDAAPFFLYVALTAPHSPQDAKSQDLQQFPDLEGTQKIIAAMVLAADRAVGKVLRALDDHGIADETIVVFLNDNGGRDFQDNRPFRGSKGRTYEGGIRVPMAIRWPGMPRGMTFRAPVIALDILPTLMAAAGSPADSVDGVDLAPYLTGQIQSPPHGLLWFRHVEEWAVRWGEWKLVRPDFRSPDVFLFNLASDPSESTDLYASRPAVVTFLSRELTLWEATLDKPHWGNVGDMSEINRFDHFRFAVAAPVTPWSAPAAWYREDSSELATMYPADGYADAVLEFPTAEQSYTAANDLSRMTGETFMLNRLLVDGPALADSARAGSIVGAPLLLAPSRGGVRPSIESAARDPRFAFVIGVELGFIGDLRLTGGGDSPLSLAAPLREYAPGQSITKDGLSTISLTSTAACTGPIAIEEGRLDLYGMGAGLESRTAVSVSAGATLRPLGSKGITAPVLQSNGRVDSDGLVVVDGDYASGPGASLHISLGGTTPGSGHDQLVVQGGAGLGGVLHLEVVGGFAPQAGDTFRVVRAGSVSGRFDSLAGPQPGPGLTYAVEYDGAGVTVVVRCAADFNGDGAADTRDVVAFLRAWASGDSSADFDGDGSVDSRDVVAFLDAWGMRC